MSSILDSTRIRTALSATRSVSSNQLVTAKVVSVDPAGHAIAVVGPLGNTRSFSVNPAVDLNGVSVGDEVSVRCTQGLAIVVEKAD